MIKAAPLKAIVLIFCSENSVLRCRLVISASLGCFQLPGLSVTTGFEACLTGVDCSLVVTVETAEGTLVVTCESAEEDMAVVGLRLMFQVVLLAHEDGRAVLDPSRDRG
jgi:hypothetical protein